MNRIAATTLIALMFLAALAVPVLAADGCVTIGPVPGGLILWCPEQGEVQPTPTPQPTATSTPLPEATATPNPPVSPLPTPTSTPHVHPTTAPTATPAPGATPIAMYPSAPMCPPEAHDTQTWHGVWNSRLGCFHDHTHGDDPAKVNDIFGPLTAYWGGLVPPFGQDFEHHAGEQHGGWKVEVGRDIPNANCFQRASFCLKAYRILTHFGPTGAKRANHTVWAELLMHDQSGRQSIVKTGGTWVLPALQSPYTKNVIQSDVPLAWLNEYQFLPGYGTAKRSPDSVDPYKHHMRCSTILPGLTVQNARDRSRELGHAFGADNVHFWIAGDNNPNADGGQLYGQNPFVNVAQIIDDAHSCVEGTHQGLTAEPYVWEIAPQACPLLTRNDTNGNPVEVIGCRFNNSNGHDLFKVIVDVGGFRTRWLDNSGIDRDRRSGWMDINTYIKPILTNPDGSMIIGRPDPRRFFTEAATCTAPGANCVPFQFVGPVTYAYWETPEGAGSWRFNNNHDAGFDAQGRLLPGYGNTWVLGRKN